MLLVSCSLVHPVETEIYSSTLSAAAGNGRTYPYSILALLWSHHIDSAPWVQPIAGDQAAQILMVQLVDQQQAIQVGFQQLQQFLNQHQQDMQASFQQQVAGFQQLQQRLDQHELTTTGRFNQQAQRLDQLIGQVGRIDARVAIMFAEHNISQIPLTKVWVSHFSFPFS